MKQLSLTVISFLLLACNNPNKTAYINISKVYGEIKISQQYKDHLEQIQTQLASKIKAKRTSNQVTKDAVLAKKNPTQADLAIVFKLQSELDSVEGFYSNSFNDSSLLYNQKVKDLVNDLVYQYGLENNYSYLFSPASSNSFMYADSTLDISDKVIQYIDENTN